MEEAIAKNRQEVKEIFSILRNMREMVKNTTRMSSQSSKPSVNASTENSLNLDKLNDKKLNDSLNEVMDTVSELKPVQSTQRVLHSRAVKRKVKYY